MLERLGQSECDVACGSQDQPSLGELEFRSLFIPHPVLARPETNRVGKMGPETP